MRLTALFFLFLLTACSNSLDEKKIEPNTTFLMTDNLMGTILQSSDRKEIGRKVSFIGLNSDQPKVLFESSVTFPLKKVFESEKTVSLVLVASGSGSIDGFVIDKTTGKFSRISAGSVFGVYSTASLGVCK